jgi:hypothetical protein
MLRAFGGAASSGFRDALFSVYQAVFAACARVCAPGQVHLEGNLVVVNIALFLVVCITAEP